MTGSYTEGGDRVLSVLPHSASPALGLPSISRKDTLFSFALWQPRGPVGHPRALGTLFDGMGLLKHLCCFNCVPGAGGLGRSLHFFLGKSWVPRGGVTQGVTVAGGGQCQPVVPLSQHRLRVLAGRPLPVGGSPKDTHGRWKEKLVPWLTAAMRPSRALCPAVSVPVVCPDVH